MSKIFLIFTYRPEFVHTWGSRSYHNQMTLNRLSNRESLTMVSHLLEYHQVDKEIEDLILVKNRRHTVLHRGVHQSHSKT